MRVKVKIPTIVKSVPVILAILVPLSSCCKVNKEYLSPGKVDLEEIANSDYFWTGVAVSKGGRLFVCFPRWGGSSPYSVAEITSGGSMVPYPDSSWNAGPSSDNPNRRLICVQSVYVDGNNKLWILDSAPMGIGGLTENKAKLIQVDLVNDEVEKIIPFDDSIIPPGSYLNDIRIDKEGSFAYLTDSGLGAIVVVNLQTGQSWRRLANHPSTKSEGIAITIDDVVWQLPGSNLPEVHSDGLALDQAGEYLYYQALTGKSLYRIATRWLRDNNLSEQELGAQVERVLETGPADGIIFAPDGNLYLTAIEANAIKRMTPEYTIETVIQDSRLVWPDGFAIGPSGSIYVTTSQLHLLFQQRSNPFRLFKLISTN